MGEASIRSGDAGREAARDSANGRKLSKDKEREVGGGSRDGKLGPGNLLPTPSFQIKEDTGRRFWGLGGGKKEKDDKRLRRNSHLG